MKQYCSSTSEKAIFISSSMSLIFRIPSQTVGFQQLLNQADDQKLHLINVIRLSFFSPLNMRLTFYPNHNTTLYYTMLLIITSIYGGNKKYGSRERK